MARHAVRRLRPRGRRGEPHLVQAAQARPPGRLPARARRRTTCRLPPPSSPAGRCRRAGDRLGLGWVQQSQALAAASGRRCRCTERGLPAPLRLRRCRRRAARRTAARGRRCSLADVDAAFRPMSEAAVDRGARRADGAPLRARDAGRGALHRPRRVARAAHRPARGAAGGGDRRRVRAAARRRAARAHAARRAGRGGRARQPGSPRRRGAAPRPADPLHARHAGRRRGRGDAAGRGRGLDRGQVRRHPRPAPPWRRRRAAPLQPRPERDHRLLPGGGGRPPMRSTIGW